MSFRFYLGPAGSGKSWRCYEEIAERLRREPGPGGAPLVLLLPEQATAQAEQAMLEMPGVGGFSRLRVLSFKRLAHFILEETGGAGGPALDDQARQLLLQSLMLRHREALRLYGASVRESGFAARIDRSFRELAYFRHGPQALDAARSALEREGRGEGLLARKLHDLALLARAWQGEWLGRFRNPDHFLDELAARLADSGVVRGAEVWIDGFASFMPQELAVLEALFRQAARVRVCLLLDPAELGGLASAPASVDETRLFAQTEETCLRLEGLARELGMEIEPPLSLPEAGQPHRFFESPILAQLERRLREQGMLPRRGLAPCSSDCGLPLSPGPLTLVEASDPRAEVEAAVRMVQRLCRAEGYRYRELAFVLRDLERYEPLLRTAFERYGIPYFMDRRRAIAHHPLVEYLRNALRLGLGQWDRESVCGLLKTDLAGVARARADAAENRSLAERGRGARWWMERADRELEAPAPTLAEALGPLWDLQRGWAGGESGLAAERFCGDLTALLEAHGVAARMEAWREAAEAERDLEQAEEHEQAWVGVCGLLEGMAATLGGQEHAPRELAALFEAQLENLSLGLLPPSLDQVLVGAIERSRQPALRALFVLGMNEGVFPRLPGEDVVFSDQERAELESLGLELGPGARRRLFMERYLGYVALTRSSERLWVSWSAADEQGVARAPSPYLGSLFGALEGVEEGVELRRVDQDWLRRDWQGIEGPRRALERWAEARYQSRPGAEDEALLGRLREGLARLPESAGRLERLETMQARRGGDERVGEALRPLLRGRDRLISVSRLEQLALCPFRFLCNYGLKLEEREEFSIHPLDLGSFHHAVLARVYELLCLARGGKGALDWGTVSPAEAEAALDRALVEQSEEDEDFFLLRGGMEPQQIEFHLERWRRSLAGVLDFFIRQGREDAFLQSEAELGFGQEGAALPPLELPVAGGEPYRLRGVIDRVDRYGDEAGGLWLRVIDFKTGERRLDLGDVLQGFSLQLPLYMAVLLGREPRAEPAGIFYQRLQPKPDTTDRLPEADEPPGESLLPRLKPRGALDLGALECFGASEPGAAMRFVQLSLKKDGEVARFNSSDAVPPGLLRRLCERALGQAGRLAARLEGGDYPVRPAMQGGWLACETCVFADVCRFDPLRDERLRLRSLDRKAACEQLEGGEPDG